VAEFGKQDITIQNVMYVQNVMKSLTRSKQMNLYVVKIGPNDFDYDQRDSCVVAAENDFSAKYIADLPGHIDEQTVELIGVSNSETPKILHTSFIRG